jgi:hypothetical protein
MAFVRFFSATFGAGVNATHCPITRPKRRIQSKRYAKCNPKICSKNYKNQKMIDKQDKFLQT